MRHLWVWIYTQSRDSRKLEPAELAVIKCLKISPKPRTYQGRLILITLPHVCKKHTHIIRETMIIQKPDCALLIKETRREVVIILKWIHFVLQQLSKLKRERAHGVICILASQAAHSLNPLDSPDRVSVASFFRLSSSDALLGDSKRAPAKLCWRTFHIVRVSPFVSSPKLILHSSQTISHSVRLLELLTMRLSQRAQIIIYVCQHTAYFVAVVAPIIKARETCALLAACICGSYKSTL